MSTAYQVYAGPAAVCRDPIGDVDELLSLASLGDLDDVAAHWYGAWSSAATHRAFRYSSNQRISNPDSTIADPGREIAAFEQLYAADIAALHTAYRIVEVCFVVVAGVD